MGQLCARQGGQVITRFRTDKTAGLLAYLAFYGERSHPRAELSRIFWPNGERAAQQNNLRVSLASLRAQLELPGVPHGADGNPGAGPVEMTGPRSIRIGPSQQDGIASDSMKQR